MSDGLPDAVTMQKIIDEHRERGEQPFWYHHDDMIVMGTADYGPPNLEWKPIVIDGRFRGYRLVSP